MALKRKVALFAAVSLASFAAGWIAGRGGAPPARRHAVLYWHDPMHPAYRSDMPGVAPDCGMKLEPVYDDAANVETQPAGTLTIDSAKQQLIGVRTGVAERSGGRRAVRCVGRVAAEEGRVYRVSPGVDGWIRRVEGGAATGSVVQRDQPLAVFGSRDILSPQQAYVYALEGQDRLAGRAPDAQELALVQNQIAQATQALEGIGLSGPQLQELARTRTPSHEIQLSSPTSGIVVHRDAEVGQRFERFAVLFRVADLSRVWVLADVYPQDAALINPGQKAELATPGGQRLHARVCTAPPQFDGGSRTFKVRLEADNPRLELRPEMVVDVELEAVLPESIVVPAEAVLDSGVRTIVYVDRGEGRFEPRQVETGWRSGERVEIKSGLAEGERIVLSGQFLVDSESRLRAPAVAAKPAGTRQPAGTRVADPAQPAPRPPLPGVLEERNPREEPSTRP